MLQNPRWALVAGVLIGLALYWGWMQYSQRARVAA